MSDSTVGLPFIGRQLKLLNERFETMEAIRSQHSRLQNRVRALESAPIGDVAP